MGEVGSLKFSVIMPCYNSEAYVRAAVESVLKQSFFSWELVAINDGSIDTTLSILNEYAARDQRIHVFSKPNGGYVSAINAGLERATGDYCIFLGSDDTIAPDLLKNLDSAFDHAEKPDCIIFRTLLYRNNEKIGCDELTSFTNSVSQFDTNLAAFSEAYPVHAQILFGRDTSKCYRRATLGSLRMWGRYGFDADGIFSMLFGHRSKSFLALPIDGYLWNQREGSLSSRKSFLEQDCDRVVIWTSFYRTLLELPLQEIALQERQYLYYFTDVIAKAWYSADLSKRSIISQACKTVLYMEQKTGQTLSIGRERRIMLRFPLFWKLFIRLFPPKKL